MKANTAWVLGVLATIAGWIWLIFGTSAGGGLTSARVFNLHLGALAEQLCLLGYSLMIIGAVQSAAAYLADRLAQRPTSVIPPTSPEDQMGEGQIDLSPLMTGQSMAAKREEAMTFLNRTR